MDSKYFQGVFYRKNKFKKGRKTLFFIHGMTSGSYAWKDYFKTFSKDYNLIALDLRGHGKSNRYLKYEDYAIEKFSEDIFRIFKKEKLKDTILISHSYGNFVSFSFLWDHQNLVKKVVFISVSYKLPRKRVTKLLSYALRINPAYKITNKKQPSEVDYSHYLNTGDFNLRRIYADISNTGFASFAFALRNLLDIDFYPFLYKIKIPTLIIHGKKDKIFSYKDAVKISKTIEGSKLVIVNKADHTLVLNNVSDLYKEIKEFSK
ncbi:MAG TPA: alpha/beta hydrolase [Candidatus Nanoarchaeia archaeon]|nr:alpha/beta hydrolase [Candidatus Nanoarchaeia archaeon]